MRLYQVTRPPERAKDSFVLHGQDMDWQTVAYGSSMACSLLLPRVACRLFLYGPWAKNDFYIFKDLLKKIRDEHAAETVCDPQSINIYYMSHYGKNFLTAGLEHPILALMCIWILEASFWDLEWGYSSDKIPSDAADPWTMLWVTRL